MGNVETIIVYAQPLLSNIYQCLVCDDEPVEVTRGMIATLTNVLIGSDGWPRQYDNGPIRVFITPEVKEMDIAKDIYTFIGCPMLYQYGPFSSATVSYKKCLGQDLILEVVNVEPIY